MHGNAQRCFVHKVRAANVVLHARKLVLEDCVVPAHAVVAISDLKQLLQQAIAILQTEATVVELPAPCKVFGDIHGQFTDLKKFFATYGVCANR